MFDIDILSEPLNIKFFFLFYDFWHLTDDRPQVQSNVKNVYFCRFFFTLVQVWCPADESTFDQIDREIDWSLKQRKERKTNIFKRLE